MDIALITLYIIISIVAIYRCDRHSRVDYMFLLLLGGLLVLLCAFKPITEIADAEGYAAGFYSTEVHERIEPLSALLIVISKKLFATPVGLFLLFAIVAISIRFYGIARYSAFLWSSVAIYLYQIFILHDLIQIRASIASAILICSIGPLYQRNVKLYFLLSIIATLFHYSAVVMFPLWLLQPDRIKRSVYYFILPICYFCAFSGITLGHMIQYIPVPFIQQGFAAYKLTMASSDLEINITSWPQIVRCLLFLFILLNYKRIVYHYKYIIILLKIYVVGLSSYIMLADIPTFANRISELLFVFEIFLFPSIAYMIKPRRLGLVLPLAVGFILMLVNIYHFKLIPS